jgi:hypothetical protein
MLVFRSKSYYNRGFMRNPISLLLPVLALAAAHAAAPEKLAVSSKVETLGKSRGRLVLSFKPDPQYDFNRTPPMTVEVEAAPGVTWEQVKQSPKDGKPAAGSNYYGQILPVEFVYTLSSPAPPEARARVTYFYCSKKDGFCARETKNVMIPLARSEGQRKS